MGTSAIQQCNPRAKSGIEALHALQLRDADAVRELLTDAQQRTAQLQADLMQARQDTQQASLAYQRERVRLSVTSYIRSCHYVPYGAPKRLMCMPIGVPPCVKFDPQPDPGTVGCRVSIAELALAISEMHLTRKALLAGSPGKHADSAGPAEADRDAAA